MALLEVIIGILLLGFAAFLIYYLFFDNGRCTSKKISPPTNFKATSNNDGGTNNYVLTWTASPNVAGYTIYISTDKNFKPGTDNLLTTINNATTTTYNGSILFAQPTYFYISSFVNEKSDTCYSQFAPSSNTPLEVQINSLPFGMTLSFIQSDECDYYNKAQSFATTPRSCPYSINTADNSDKKGGNQIGFEFTKTLSDTNKFIFNSLKNITPANNSNLCVYYNTVVNANTTGSVPCYTSCSSIPDNYKQWDAIPSSIGSYIKLSSESLYIVGSRKGDQSEMHGPFGRTNQPKENLDCSADVFPLWEPIN